PCRSWATCSRSVSRWPCSVRANRPCTTVGPGPRSSGPAGTLERPCLGEHAGGGTGSGGKSQQARGVGVHVVDPAHRADLPCGEVTTGRASSQDATYCQDVVVGTREHPTTPTVAGEQQPGPDRVLGTELGQSPSQVVIGRTGVAHLEPHRLTHLDH